MSPSKAKSNGIVSQQRRILKELLDLRSSHGIRRIGTGLAACSNQRGNARHC